MNRIYHRVVVERYSPQLVSQETGCSVTAIRQFIKAKGGKLPSKFAYTHTATKVSTTTTEKAPSEPEKQKPVKTIKCGYCTQEFDKQSLLAHIRLAHRKGSTSRESTPPTSKASSPSPAPTTVSATGAKPTQEQPKKAIKIPPSIATSMAEIDILVKYDDRPECPESKIGKLYNIKHPTAVTAQMKQLGANYRRFYEGFVDKEFDKTVTVCIFQEATATVFAVPVNKSQFAAGPPVARKSVLLHVTGEPGRGCAVSLVVEDKSPKSMLGMSVEGRKQSVLDRKIVRRFFGGVTLTAASTVTRQPKMILRFPINCIQEALDLKRFAACRGLQVVTLEVLAKFSQKVRDDPLTMKKTKSNETLIGCAATGDKDKAQLAAYNQELVRVVGVQEVNLDDEQEEEEEEAVDGDSSNGTTNQPPAPPTTNNSTTSQDAAEGEIEVVPVVIPLTKGV